MRILIINYEFPPLGGGGGVASYQIARRLVARGHEIDVLTTGRRDLPSTEVIEGLAIHRVPVVGRADLATATLLSMLSFFPSSLLKGSQILRKRRYDILNTHFAIPSGPTGVVLSRLFDIPHVLTIIGGDIYDPTKKLAPNSSLLLRTVVRCVLNSSSQIVAISGDIQRRARRDYRCDKDIQVIHYGLSPVSFESKTRADLGIPQGDMVLISIGRLIKRKALDDLLLAVSKLGDQKFRLLIIGEGPEERRLRGLAERLGLASRVDFLGAIWGEAKFQYLGASDMFVLPSAHEGFGLVFLEAMYCGLPVIASSSGGQTDFLRDGATGFLVPPGDVDTLADRIQRLSRDEALRKEISEFNRHYVGRFDIAEVARQYEALFSRVVQRSTSTVEQQREEDSPPSS
jgi:glycosyltransferase involved in cell wall biosynthesis